MRSEDKIIKAFYDAQKPSLYFSEIKDLTGLSNSSLQNATKALLKEKTLEKHSTKANAFFTIADKKKKALEFSKIAMHSFEGLNINVKMPLKEFIAKCPTQIVSIVLFGSAVRKKEVEKSDLDLMIVLNKFKDELLQQKYEKEMTKNFEKIKSDVQARSTHNISLAFTDEEDFKKNIDHLTIQAKKTGFPIINQQMYYEVLMNDY